MNATKIAVLSGFWQKNGLGTLGARILNIMLFEKNILFY